MMIVRCSAFFDPVEPRHDRGAHCLALQCTQTATRTRPNDANTCHYTVYHYQCSVCCRTLPRTKAATRTRPNDVNSCAALTSNCPRARIHSPQLGRPPGPTRAPTRTMMHHGHTYTGPPTTASPSSAAKQPRAHTPTLQTHALHFPATVRTRGSTPRRLGDHLDPPGHHAGTIMPCTTTMVM
jgi:hypothetical protein